MITATDVNASTVATPRMAHRRVRGGFWMALSGALLLTVLVGFTPTLYLRPLFNVPAIPWKLILHGAILTTWFLGVFVQTCLIRAHRTRIHRRLGWGLSLVGIAAVVVSLDVALNFVPRQRALGRDIEAGIAGLSSVVWTDIVGLICFVAFLSVAVWLRRRPELHKRLMLLASISIVSPSMARIWGFWGIRSPERDVLSLVALVVLLLGVAVYDWVSDRRVHPVTAVGATFFVGLRILGGFIVAGSEVGRSFVRGL